VLLDGALANHSELYPGMLESEDISPLPFHKGGATGAEVLFSIIGNLMVYEDRVETNLSQLFVHTENSEWLSIISNIIL